MILGPDPTAIPGTRDDDLLMRDMREAANAPECPECDGSGSSGEEDRYGPLPCDYCSGQGRIL